MKQKWLSLEYDNGWQIIIPDVDIDAHSETKNNGENELAYIKCHCKPKVDYLNKIIIHNSFYDNKRIDDSLNNLNIKI